MTIFGRDLIIQSLWRFLEGDDHNGLVISATRRIGKTTIIKKMEEEASGRGYTAIYQDLEGVYSTKEFLENVRGQLRDLLPKNAFSRFYQAFLKGSKLGAGGFDYTFGGESKKEAWVDELRKLFDQALSKVRKKKKKLLLLWDEFPVMLSNIMRPNKVDVTPEGIRDACQILDLLRDIRHKYKDIKMVFTGSIGVHLVISALKKNGYNNMPLNDLKHQEVPPLAQSDALELAMHYAKKYEIELSMTDLEELIEAVDLIPRYICVLIEQISVSSVGKSPKILLEQFLRNSLHDFDFSHFETRIPKYYDSPDMVLRIVDFVAYRELCSYDEIIADLTNLGPQDNNSVRRVIDSLVNDHYFEIDDQNKVKMRFQLLRKWWKFHRNST